MRDPNNPCLFCNIKESGQAGENTLAYASYDTYPVSDLHCLIIPKRHVKDYFELTKNEVIACNELIKKIKGEIGEISLVFESVVGKYQIIVVDRYERYSKFIGQN